MESCRNPSLSSRVTSLSLPLASLPVVAAAAVGGLRGRVIRDPSLGAWAIWVLSPSLRAGAARAAAAAAEPSSSPSPLRGSLCSPTMDPTSANQYQNLHYTFQNLALSPPPPPPSEMPSLPPPPEGAYYDDYQQHQQHDQQHPPHSQQQQQQQQYYDQQSARHDVRSVGRNGWNNGGASQGQAVTGRSSNGKGGRSALPSVRSQPSFLFYFSRFLFFFSSCSLGVVL